MQKVIMRIVVSRRFRCRWKGCHGYSELIVLRMRRVLYLRTMHCQVSLFPRPKAAIYLADAAAIKVRNALSQTRCILIFDMCIAGVTTYRARFPKPVGIYVPLLVFGRNIVASEGEEWKRYRAITAPAFSEVRTGTTGCRSCPLINITSREILD